jgi:hypothetical protein
MPLQLTTPTNPGLAQWTVGRSQGDPGLVALPADLFVNNTTGSDVTGTGTLANPWAILAHAMLQIPVLADDVRTIHLAQSGVSYTVPARTLWAFNLCTVSGELVNDGQGTLTSTAGTGGTEAAGTNVEVAGAGWAVDEHVGKLILWSTGGLTGRYGVVYQNDADTLFVTTQNTSYTAPVAGDQFELLGFGSRVEWDPGTPADEETASANRNLFFQNLRFNITTPGTDRSLQNSSISRIDYRRCYFDQDISCVVITDGGRARFRTCYFTNRGDDFAERGLLQAGKNASCELFQGSVVDCRFATAADPAGSGIKGKAASTPRWQGELVIRGMGTLGYNFEGCMAGKHDNAGTMNLVRFVDCQRGFIINGNVEEGGGYYGLPDLYGNVTGDYVVTAQHYAQVTIGGAWPTLGGSATSALGVMAVSADNGASQCSFTEDRTLIYGGSPVAGESVDPGTGNPIPPVLQGSVPFAVGGGAETNTLAAPTRSGQELALVANTVGGGTRAVTFAAPINAAGDTIATFNAAGDFLQLRGTRVGGALVWRVIANDGVALT